MSAFEDTLRAFLEYFEKISNSQDEDVFLREFMTLKSQSAKYRESNVYPAEAGQKPCNKKKNRFKDILPFEYTRVSLHPVEGVDGSDYINANYITGPDDEVTYIAAQGPLPNTVDDFWRMLWYHNIEIVVMACREVEMGKKKCQRYWPNLHESKLYGSVQVTTVKEENVSNDFVIRDFKAECQGEEQTIRQYHYAAWPDHGKPKSCEPIFRMIEKVHLDRKRLEVPIAVHCSAGCGRTGTILAVDIARTMILNQTVPETLSINSIVEKMRQQRPAMVQAKDQYIFVYLATVELCRRALGIQPELPEKPSVVKDPYKRTESPYENLAVKTADSPRSGSQSPQPPNGDTTSFNNKDTFHQNSSLVPPPVPHSRRNKQSIDSEPIAPPRSKGGYENVETRNTSSPLPGKSPPVARKPVSRQSSNKGLATMDDTSSQAATTGDDMYENLKAQSKPSPVPRPRRQAGKEVESNGSLGVSTANRSKQPSPPAPRKLPQLPERATTPTNRPLPPEPLPKHRSPEPPRRLPPDVPSRDKTPSHTPRTSTPERSNRSSTASNPIEPTDSMYSTVDMSQITDTGPSIMVVCGETGKKAPLERVEQELDKFTTPPQQQQQQQLDSSTNSKTSIAELIMSQLDDEILESVSEEPPPPRLPTPPLPQRSNLEDSLGEIPPDIPRRTTARLELLDEPVVVGDKKTDKVHVAEQAGFSGTYDVVGGGTSDGVYEHPLPMDQSQMITNTTTTPSSARSSQSPVRTNHSPTKTKTVNPSSSGGLKLGNLGKKFFSRSTKEKKKVTSADISVPVGSMVKSSSDHGISSSFNSESKSKQQLTTSFPTNVDRFNFPGDRGYGIRIGKPHGPRQEPQHWKIHAITTRA